MTFEEALPIRSTLYDALPHRQCSRSIYDGQRLPRGEINLLERAARRPGVHAIFLPSAERSVVTVSEGSVHHALRVARHSLPERALVSDRNS